MWRRIRGDNPFRWGPEATFGWKVDGLQRDILCFHTSLNRSIVRPAKLLDKIQIHSEVLQAPNQEERERRLRTRMATVIGCIPRCRGIPLALELLDKSPKGRLPAVHHCSDDLRRCIGEKECSRRDSVLVSDAPRPVDAEQPTPEGRTSGRRDHVWRSPSVSVCRIADDAHEAGSNQVLKLPMDVTAVDV